MRGSIIGGLESGIEGGFGGVTGANPGKSSKETLTYGFACNVFNTIDGLNGCIPVCLKADYIVSGLNACLRIYSKTAKNSVTGNVMAPVLTALLIAWR
jgi:hypothetical protein